MFDKAETKRRCRADQAATPARLMAFILQSTTGTGSRTTQRLKTQNVKKVRSCTVKKTNVAEGVEGKGLLVLIPKSSVRKALERR